MIRSAKLLVAGIEDLGGRELFQLSQAPATNHEHPAVGQAHGVEGYAYVSGTAATRG